MSGYPKSVQRDDMRIDWDVPIEMKDGLTPRADVYPPIEDGECPVIAAYGIYVTWLHFLSTKADSAGE